MSLGCWNVLDEVVTSSDHIALLNTETFRAKQITHHDYVVII